MKKTSVSMGRVLKLSALITCLGALAVASGMGCAGHRYNQSTAERSDNDADSSRVREPLRAPPTRSRDMSLRGSPTSPMGSPIGSFNF